jgi:serine/threonine protein kinase
MEYLPLGSLTGAIRKKKLVKEWGTRQQLMMDIFEGMAFLHSSKMKRSLLHQDLKTGNVLVLIQGGKLRGKIADFGLACECPMHF